MSKIKIVLLLAIAVVLVIVFMGKNKKDDKIETLVEEENAVLVMDQQPGEETVVSYAKLSKPGYVKVYSTDTSGKQEVLGTSSLLSAGEHKNIKVVHSGMTSKKGSKISAVVVADDGDELYSETDSEVLVETSVEESMAEISEEAVLDENISDEDLENLLEDAGYTTEEESSDESGSENSMEDSVESGTEGTDESMETFEETETPTMEDENTVETEVNVEVQ